MEEVDVEVGESDTLDADAKAYFESRGEKLPTAEPAKAVEAEKEPETVEAEGEGGEKDAPPVEDRNPNGLDARGLAAVRAEREEKKALRAEKEEAQRKMAVLEDRMNLMLAAQAQAQQQQPQPEQPDPEPDPNVDIFAHNAWMARQQQRLNAQLAEMQKQAQQQAEAAQAQRAEAEIWNDWRQSAAVEKAANPEFEGALKFMSERRVRELAAYGEYNPQFKTQQGILNQINAELKGVILDARRNNISPAKAIFTLAKSWGYAPAPKPAEDPARAVEALARNVNAETSMSGTGGSRPNSGPTAKDIADMSPDEFEAWFAKHGESGFKRIARGRPT